MLILITCFIMGSASSNILPDDLPVCHRSSELSNCLLTFFNSFKAYSTKGVKEIYLPPFDPLVINSINITHRYKQDEFVVYLRELVYYNIQSYNVTSVKLNDTSITVHVNFGQLNVTTYYEIKEKPQSALLKRRSFVQATQVCPTARITVVSEVIERNGKEFCNVKNVDFDFMLYGAYINSLGLDIRGITTEPLKTNSKATAIVLSGTFKKVLFRYFETYITQLCDNVPFYDFNPIIG